MQSFKFSPSEYFALASTHKYCILIVKLKNSQFFNTIEIEVSFHENFYIYNIKGTCFIMVKLTPDNFQFSVNIPLTIIHDKKLCK